MLFLEVIRLIIVPVLTWVIGFHVEFIWFLMNKSLFFCQQILINQDKIITLLSYHYFTDNYHKNEVVYVCGSIGGLLAVFGTESIAVEF